MILDAFTIYALAALVGLAGMWYVVRAPRRPLRDARMPGDWKR